jgi:hypothetical protein
MLSQTIIGKIHFLGPVQMVVDTKVIILVAAQVFMVEDSILQKITLGLLTNYSPSVKIITHQFLLSKLEIGLKLIAG